MAYHVEIDSRLAGDESPASSSLSQKRVTEDWKRFEMAAGTTEELVYAGACRFGGVILNSGVASGTITVRDANAISGGSTGMVFAQGNSVDAKGARMLNGLTAQAGTTGAGVTILYREADFS